MVTLCLGPSLPSAFFPETVGRGAPITPEIQLCRLRRGAGPRKESGGKGRTEVGTTIGSRAGVAVAAASVVAVGTVVGITVGSMVGIEVAVGSDPQAAARTTRRSGTILTRPAMESMALRVNYNLLGFNILFPL